MKVGFEAKRFFANFTGLGNYSRFVIEALARCKPDDEYYLYTPTVRDHPEVASVLKYSNIHVVQPQGILRKPLLSALWRSLLVSNDATMNELSVFHGLSQELPLGLPSHIKKVVTIHDLIFLRYPKFYNPVDARIYKSKALHACKSADCIIAISEQTANDIEFFFKIDKEKIKVVNQGCHPIFKTEFSAEQKLKIRKKYNLPEQYLLSVGTIERRKNLMLLIRAMASGASAIDLPLIVMGRKTAYYQQVVDEAKKLGVIDKVKFLEDVPFQDFPPIYQGAEIFIYPSLFEGFGIPLVEAIESGVPVISSKGSCFVEAAGPDSIYVDASSEVELSEAIQAVLSDQNLRERMIKKSFQYIQKFQPEVIASNLSSIYSFKMD